MIKDFFKFDIIYKMQDLEKGVAVSYENENLWMTQKVMVGLFGVQRPAITKQLTIFFR